MTEFVRESPVEVHENAIDILAKGQDISTDEIRIELLSGEELIVSAVASGRMHIKRVDDSANE